jgi:hypothetical protein
MQQISSCQKPTEQALVKLYMDLTGASEAAARSVYASVCSEHEDEQGPDDSRVNSWPDSDAVPGSAERTAPDAAPPQAGLAIPVPA